MPLRKQGLREHLEASECAHETDNVQLLHDPVLRFVIEVVGLGVFLGSQIGPGLEPEALYHVLEEVQDGVLESHSVEEGEEQAVHVAWFDVGLVSVDVREGHLQVLRLLDLGVVLEVRVRSLASFVVALDSPPAVDLMRDVFIVPNLVDILN